MYQLLDMAKGFITETVIDFQKPEADVTDVSIKHADRNALSLEYNVLVSNPYSQDLPICELSFRITIGGRKIISGNILYPGSIRANDRTVVKLPITVPYAFVISILRDIVVPYDIVISILQDIGANWDIDYELIVDLIIDLPIIGNFTISLSKKGTIKLPTLSDIF